MKTCTKCGEEKPHSEYAKNGKRNGVQRYRPDCKACDRARCAKYRVDNAEARRAYDAKYRVDNAEARRAYNATPERKSDQRTYNARRRAQKAVATVEPFTAVELAAHWDEIGAYGCVVCGGPYEHADHIQPLALGGEHSVWNLLPMCSTHNTSKGARNPWVWITEVSPNSLVGRNLLAAKGDA